MIRDCCKVVRIEEKSLRAWNSLRKSLRPIAAQAVVAG